MDTLREKIYLETDRMILRELSSNDVQHIFELDSDPDVMKFLTNGTPSTLEEVRTNLKKTEELFEKHNGKFGFWAAYDRRSNEFMGWFHFRPAKSDPDNLKRIELGYRFFKRFWGKGYATEGSIALLKKGFSELGVEEVFAITMQRNLGSRRVMEKIGLTFVREFFDPNFPDTTEKDVEYVLTKQAWLKLD
jgi:RimJ/RimL family protein N-acetyltransferase